VPGSAATFTLTQIEDLFNAPDWHTGDHPVMPDVVAHGRKPVYFACGYCHLPNGQGRPESSSLAGLPVDYIVHQMQTLRAAFARVRNRSKRPIAMMIDFQRTVDADTDTCITLEFELVGIAVLVATTMTSSPIPAAVPAGTVRSTRMIFD
jgi:hypothetical protein